MHFEMHSVRFCWSNCADCKGQFPLNSTDILGDFQQSLTKIEPAKSIGILDRVKLKQWVELDPDGASTSEKSVKFEPRKSNT